jgi:uncharacterized membrane protein
LGAEALTDVDLLVQDGIQAAWAGDQARARDLLNLAVQLDQANVQGWLALSGVVDSLVGKEYCLRRVLALEPGNRVAGRRLARLGKQAWRRERPRLLRRAQREALQARPGVQAVAATQELGPARRPGPKAAESTGEMAGEASANGFAQAGSAPAAWVEGAQPRPGDGFREEAALRAGLVMRNEFALIAALGLVLLALIALSAAGVDSLPLLLALLRTLLGLAVVLFVPGYALQAALFPRPADLDGPERLALSFGLSVALVAPLALILDGLEWGIRLWPVVAGEALLIAAFSAVAVLRRRFLPAEERPVFVLEGNIRDWWASQGHTGRSVYGVLAVALLLAAVSTAAILILPKPTERLTEFYVLGPGGVAESYPRQAAPGEALEVTAGIANREGKRVEYRIEVRVAGQTIGGAGPVTLQDGEIWETPVRYALPSAGKDQQVEFLLYRDGAAEAYRDLRLWIDVLEESRP